MYISNVSLNLLAKSDVVRHSLARVITNFQLQLNPSALRESDPTARSHESHSAGEQCTGIREQRTGASRKIEGC